MNLHEVIRNTLQNYPDSKCCYGYMTLCDACIKYAPRHVNTSAPIKGLPIVRCEMCERKHKS